PNPVFPRRAVLSGSRTLNVDPAECLRALSPVTLPPPTRSMSRLLLALFLLSTLSACQPPADDTDHELPPERRDETDAQAGWTLPWYYLAAPVCLVGGTVAADPV